jgi:hypothetical protein
MTMIGALALFIVFFLGFLGFIRFCVWILSRREMMS